MNPIYLPILICRFLSIPGDTLTLDVGMGGKPPSASHSPARSCPPISEWDFEHDFLLFTIFSTRQNPTRIYPGEEGGTSRELYLSWNTALITLGALLPYAEVRSPILSSDRLSSIRWAALSNKSRTVARPAAVLATIRPSPRSLKCSPQSSRRG